MRDDVDVQTTRLAPRVLGSLVGHLLVVVVLFFWPSSAPPALPVMVTVDLIAALPSPAGPPRPAARPRPAPAPAPAPKPVQKKVVLPKQAPAVKPKPKPVAKPKPVKRPTRVERPSRPKPEPVLDYEDALDLLRVEQGEERPVVAQPQSEESGDAVEGTASPNALPGQAGWHTAARRHVRKDWIMPPEFLDRPLSTGLLVTLAADGSVIGKPRVTHPSGDPFWDDNTVRAIQKASPLPPPPEPGEWQFVFTP